MRLRQRDTQRHSAFGCAISAFPRPHWRFMVDPAAARRLVHLWVLQQSVGVFYEYDRASLQTYLQAAVREALR